MFWCSALVLRASRIISSEMSMPTTRPAGASFASLRESHPDPHPTSSTLSAARIHIFSSTGSTVGKWSRSIPSPRPASAHRLNSSRKAELAPLFMICPDKKGCSRDIHREKQNALTTRPLEFELFSRALHLYQ
jgi:hypothetical protein